MAQSGNSSGDQSGAKLLRPSAEVEVKMQPVSRDAFHSLLRKAITAPSQEPHSAAK